jgi:serine O-acetyltransferase
VTLGAQSTLVGDITVGDDANVGAGAVVVEDVPAGATVVGNPAERVDGGEPTASAAESATEDAEGDEASTVEERSEVPGAAAKDAAAEETADDATSPTESPACCGATGAS